MNGNPEIKIVDSLLPPEKTSPAGEIGFSEAHVGNYLVKNLIPVTFGKIKGVSAFVGLACWYIYKSKWNRASSTSQGS